MRSRSYIFLLVVLVLTILSSLLYYFGKFNLGLDVVGGARLVYQLELTKVDKDNPQSSGSIQRRVIQILQSRVEGAFGASEVTIQAKGKDQVVIEIPGKVNIDSARELLGTTASLECYWAKNVVTNLRSQRRYKEIEPDQKSRDISLRYMDNFDSKGEPFDWKDPRYKEMIKGWQLILKGDDLAEAQPGRGGSGVIPSMSFSPAGASKLEAWTRKYKDEEENIAFVLDDKVISMAPLQRGQILSDNAQITGKFDPGYVQNLCNLLNSGALPVKLTELSAQKVDPTIGQGALSQIVTAGIAAFAVIVAFMLIYYLFPGVIAVIALCLYVLFTLSVMKWFVTFSLAAIAGFILSVGMAVDANILVFERVKEELRLGKPLKIAIDLGFKRALSAIVDSNTCTILTSLVLAYYGTGPVKGFASTLIVGVVISLFTAITVTRSLLGFIVGSGYFSDPNHYGLKRQWFGESLEAGATHKPLQIANKCGRYFIISLIPIVPGIIFYFMGGVKKNVEFQGGYEVEIALKDKSITTNQIADTIAKNGIPGSNVKLLSSEGRALITIPPSDTLETNKKADIKKIAEVAGFTREDVVGFTSVGPVVQAETIYNAIKGVIISSLLIVIFLGIRFGVAVGGFFTGLRFSFAAIVALLHDILVVIGLSAIVGYLLGWSTLR